MGSYDCENEVLIVNNVVGESSLTNEYGWGFKAHGFVSKRFFYDKCVFECCDVSTQCVFVVQFEF